MLDEDLLCALKVLPEELYCFAKGEALFSVCECEY